MIALGRFYSSALANADRLDAEDFRDQASAARNPQRVRRADSADGSDDNRAPRNALVASISGDRQGVPRAEVRAVKTKLGVDSAAQEGSGRPIEARTVREVVDSTKDRDAVDRAIDAVLNEVSPGSVVTASPQETPAEFRTALGNALQEVGSAIRQTYGELPPDERTPETLRRTLEAIRQVANVCREQMRVASRPGVDLDTQFMVALGLIGAVMAASGILSAVTSVLEVMKAVLESSWKADGAELKQTAQAAKERMQEMLERIRQLLAELKRMLARSQAPARRACSAGLPTSESLAAGSGGLLQQAAAKSAMSRLEDVEKLVAGYERRMKERYAAGDAVKVV